MDLRDSTCFFLFLFLKSGTADAGARARGHFNKAALQLSIHRVLQRCDAVLHAVHRQITPAGLALHGAQDAAGHRKHPGQLDRTGGVRIADHDAAFPQPVLQLVKGQVIIRAVRAAQSHRLCLFGDAGAEKHDSSARAALTDQACHRPKRRHHRRHIGDRIREIFLHVLIDRRTAGGDHRPFSPGLHKPLIFPFYQMRAFGGFINMGKAQLLHGAGKRVPAVAVKIGGERRRHRCGHVPALGHQPAHI